MHYSIHRESTPGPQVWFNCPKCGVDSGGPSFEQVDTLKFLYLVPLFKTSQTMVQCFLCKAKLRSQLSLAELQEYEDADVTDFVFHDISFVFKFLAIVSLLISWIPIIGLSLACISLIGTWRHGGWTKILSIIALVIGLLITLIAITAKILRG